MSNIRRYNESKNIKKYAHTLLKYGVNLQEDQNSCYFCRCGKTKTLQLSSLEEAYELGAKEVVLNWRCSPIARQRLLC